MNWKERVRERLAGLDLDPATEAETIEELTQHVEDRYRDLLATGHPEEAAVARAWRELEGHTKLAREIASARLRRESPPLQDPGRNGLGAWSDDVRFAWRRLCYSPGFALVGLLTVTLTVGANTAILSVADAVLFRPLPFADPDDIAIIQMRDRKTGQQSTLTPYAYLSAIDEACPSVSAVGLFEPVEWPDSTARPTFDTSDGLVNVDTWEATANYFELLGVRAARGRLFNEGDRGRERLAAVLSHAAWMRFYGGDESVVGRTIPLGAMSVDLVGVLPAGFVFPSAFAGRPAMVVLRKPLGPGDSGGTFHPIVRISSGVSWQRAQAEIEAATAGVVVPTDENAGVPVLREVRELLYPVGRSVMRFLLAAALFILILGCANLANMMVVRGRRGLHDTAVRVALGASRLRLIRPIVLEAVMLGLGGAGLAIGLTKLTFASLLRQVPPVAYGRAEVGVDSRVALFALLMGVLCSFAFSIVPAWRASGVDALRLIQRRGGRGSQVRLGRPLIAVQVAIAAAVIFGAVVSARAFVTVLRVSVGFSAERVAQISLGAPAVLSPAERRIALDRVLQALARRPDIESIGAAGSIPFSGRAPDSGVRAMPGGPLLVGIIYALPGYLETIGLSPIRGRLWAREDVQADPDAVVMSLGGARALFGDRDPLGAVFDDGRGRRFHVIGVVGNVRNFVDRDTAPLAYAIPPPGRGALTIVAKVRSPTASTLVDIKADIRWLFPIGLTTVTWWEDSISSNTAYQNPRFQTIVLGGLAALALILTGLGIFSVVAYVVAARAREMGVRLAIGASPQSLLRLVIRQALVPVGIGLLAGVLLIQWGRRLAEAQLFKMETSDPVALVMTGATVFAAALLAAYLPARRATRINPTEVLRAE